MWPFRKKTPAGPTTHELGPINEDWRPGDLALCLDGAWCCPEGDTARHPAKDEVCRVVSVEPSHLWHDPRRLVWALTLTAYGVQKYDASGFRKIVPDNTAEESELSRRIKRCRHARDRERLPLLLVWP